MILLGILFFAIGGISGYQIVNSFYSYPINNELTNEVYYLETEILKKEEELATKKEAEEEKINKLKEEKINPDEVPDPVIDNFWVIFVNYCFSGCLFGLMCRYNGNNLYLVLVEKTEKYTIKLKIFLAFYIVVFILTFFFKIILSLFSSLVFGVHSFYWNLLESCNLKFYFEKGWKGFGIFLLNVVFSIIVPFLIMSILYSKNKKNGNIGDEEENILEINQSIHKLEEDD